MALDFQPLDSSPPDKGGIDFQPMQSKIDFQPITADVPIPNQKYTAPESKPIDLNKEVMGAGEALWNAGSGAGAFLYHHWKGLVNGESPEEINKGMAEHTYQPRSEEGQRDAEAVGTFMNQMGIPMSGVAHLVPAPFRGKRPGPVGKDIPPPKASAVPVEPSQMELPLENSSQQVAEVRGNAVGQPDLFSADNMANDPAAVAAADARTRTRQAQTAIEQRQRELEQQVAQRTSLDMNAAERARQEQAPVPGLEDAQARETADSIARTQPYMDERNQGLIDDTDRGYVANQVGGGQPGLRIDENGMPIRADRSMEAQNLQDPLQRNLWGDELPRQSAQEATRGITAAIDRMPPGEARDAGLNQLGKPMPRSPGGRQRGAVNMDLFTPGFEKLKMINNGIQLRLKGGFDPIIQAIDRFGKQVGELKLNTDTFEQKESSNLQAGYVHVDPAMRGKGIAEQMYRFAAEHGDVQADMGHLLAAGKKMWEGFEKKGLANNEWTIPRSQRGAVDFKGIGEAFSRGVEKLHDTFDRLNPLTPKEQVLANAVGKPYIPKPDAVEQSIAKARTEQDGPTLFKNLQSGPALAAEKTGSTLVRETARWNNWGDKVSDYWKNNVVTPVQKSFAGLHAGDASTLWKAMQNEMRTRTRYTPEELAQHLSPKAQAAYKAVRAAFDDVLQKTNAQLAAMGKAPISEHEAFAAAQWDGQWHLPVYDPTGKKMVWYIKAKTEAEALRAQKWIAENSDLTTDKKPKYYNENIGRKVPRDVLGAYHDMAKFFSDEPKVLENIQDAAQHYTEAQGYKFMGHYVHFHNKAGAEGVRGYLGDRPWLSERDNAKQGLDAQTKYLRSAYDWIGKQEALANTAKLLADPELANQTNNMAMARAYTAQSMGVTKNMFKDWENNLQQFLTTSVKGHSAPADVSKFIHSVKELTYLTQLGFSPAYMVATPLQAFILGPSWHQKLGGSYNVAGVMAKSMADMAGMLPGGKPFTSLGQKAFEYMKDNGVISQNVFHENSGNGSMAPVAALRKVGGWTISAPERVARASTFLSFVHHMDEAGMFKDNQDGMFQRAEELTNHVLTDFRRSNRPLLVDKMGQIGEVGYTYKAPIFNFYNNLSVFARDALKGNPKPFLSAVGMTALLAGYVGVPLLRELDDSLQAFKGAVAQLWPQHYPAIRDWGLVRPVVADIRQAASNEAFQHAVGGPSVADFLSNTMTHGLPSSSSGVQMASRFSANIGNVRNPLDGVAPVVQEVREAVSAGKALLNPTSTNALEAVWQQMPPLGKGNMEESFDRFKGPTNAQTGEHGVINPNHLTEDENVYTRNPKEQTMRRLGVTSLKESTTKNDWYENRQEAERWKTAQESSIDKLWNGIREKQPVENLRPYAKAFYDNYGNDDGLDEGINHKIENMALDPRERAIMKAETLSKIMEIKRYLETRGELHHAN